MNANNFVETVYIVEFDYGDEFGGIFTNKSDAVRVARKRYRETQRKGIFVFSSKLNDKSAKTETIDWKKGMVTSLTKS